MAEWRMIICENYAAGQDYRDSERLIGLASNMRSHDVDQEFAGHCAVHEDHQTYVTICEVCVSEVYEECSRDQGIHGPVNHHT